MSGVERSHAALRRVATLVAHGVPPDELFAAVTREVADLVGADIAGMSRFEEDGAQTLVAAWPARTDQMPVGTRMPMFEGVNVARMVLESGRPARIDDWSTASGEVATMVRELGVRSSIGSPITVAGRCWGMVIVDRRGPDRFPDETEERVESFTELVATAIANSEARLELGRLVAEQSALRRVATLVAHGVEADMVFGVVAEEVGAVVGADSTRVFRYESDGTATVVGGWGGSGELLEVGARPPLEGDSVTARVHRTGQPARLDSFADAPGAFAATLRRHGISSAVGAPIVVAGRLWGVVIAGSESGDPFPADTETRIGEFTELVATAIANADGRAKLAESRARIVAASDDARPARRAQPARRRAAAARVAGAPAAHARAHGAGRGSRGPRGRGGRAQRHRRGPPGDLARPAPGGPRGGRPVRRARGARPSVRVPVELDADVPGRLPERVEVAAYYVASEALANAAKHAGASVVRIEAAVRDDMLELSIRDDGVGGADPARGSGLIGLVDRVEAMGGTIEVASPRGRRHVAARQAARCRLTQGVVVDRVKVSVLL